MDNLPAESATTKKIFHLWLGFHVLILVLASGALSKPLAVLLPLEINEHFLLIPDNFWSQPWTLLSHGIMHVGLLHLFMNYIALKSLVNLGLEHLSARMLCLAYGVSLIAGGVFALILTTDPSVGTAGASGAIFGIFGLLLVHHEFWGYRRVFMLFLLLNIILPLVLPIISWQAHLGGLLAGVTVGFYLNNRDYRRTVEQELLLQKETLSYLGLSETQVKNFSDSYSETLPRIIFLREPYRWVDYESLLKEFQKAIRAHYQQEGIEWEPS